MPDDLDTMELLHRDLAALTFVEIVDTLVDDFDVHEVLTSLSSRCLELFAVAAAGVLLADTAGRLQVMAASSEQSEQLILRQIETGEGPCIDCYRIGSTVFEHFVGNTSRWPDFAARSSRAGFTAVHAVPFRFKQEHLGCLHLFTSGSQELRDADVALARALADVASVAIVQDRAARRASTREAHLQHALDSRVAIEQAKGMLAERVGVGMDEAFELLRNFARNHNRRLTEVASALVAGGLALEAFVRSRRIPPPPGGAPC